MRVTNRLKILVAVASCALGLGLSCRTNDAWASQNGDPLRSVRGGLTPHTMSATGHGRGENDDAASDLVAVERILVGRWTGEGLGGVLEETWNPILGDRMLGTFRLVVDDQLVFSEHMMLLVEDGDVLLKLKHFGPDLVSWEKPDETTRFRLVDVSDDVAWFEGLTFHRRGERMDIYLAMESAGATREEALKLESAPLRP